jgi:signal transduction histidine kinase
VKIEVRADSELRVHADPDRIVQVVANLVNNAVRHSPDGGRVHASVRAAGSEAFVSIADEGPGVPPELRDQIFQRFWQSESRKRGAAGLGLAIARAIVELHDGRIWVEDAPRGGACFCFTLPLHPRE